jgi:hypothetical protein
MIRSVATLAAAALLGGCVYSHEEILGGGSRVDFERSGAPEAVAGCIARQADDFRDGNFGLVRRAAAAGTYEVILRNTLAWTPLAIGHVAPAGRGSRVTLSFVPVFMDSARDEFVELVKRKC